jgi:cadmium resistance protein CadD (predicted permease)
MNIARALWASVQGDPTFMRRFNGWSTVIFIVLVPVSAILNLVASTAFVSYLSLIALILGSLSAWQASRVEVEQARIEKEAEEKEAKRDEKLIEKIDEVTPDS